MLLSFILVSKVLYKMTVVTTVQIILEILTSYIKII